MSQRGAQTSPASKCLLGPAFALPIVGRILGASPCRLAGRRKAFQTLAEEERGGAELGGAGPGNCLRRRWASRAAGRRGGEVSELELGRGRGSGVGPEACERLLLATLAAGRRRAGPGPSTQGWAVREGAAGWLRGRQSAPAASARALRSGPGHGRTPGKPALPGFSPSSLSALPFRSRADTRFFPEWRVRMR